MTLKPDQVQQFQTHGWTMVKNLFDPHEVEAMRSEIGRLKDLGLLHNVATDGDGRSHSAVKANLQLCPIYKHSELFRALPFEPKVIQTIEQLIGSPIILHLDQLFLKPPQHGMGTHWHQDNAYFGISDPLRGTAMWIAIHDATIDNGTIELIPDAFVEALDHERDPYSDHHICCDPSEQLRAAAVPVEAAAGSAVFFCYGTPHCTGDNRSDAERAGVAYHFLHVDYAGATKNGSLLEDGRDYRPYLSGPKATAGVAEYGVKVAATWNKLVERYDGSIA